MHFLPTSYLLAAAASFSAALAMPYSPTPNGPGSDTLDPSNSTEIAQEFSKFVPRGMRAPDAYGYLDLRAYEDTALEKRTNVKYCFTTVENTARCALVSATAFGITSLATQIAGLVKSGSDNNDCKVHTSSYDDATFSFRATGRNCDTTAQTATIQGAMENWIRKEKGTVCGIQCLKLTHGGTWTGFVTIGPAGQDLSSVYCGESENYNVCGSGGEGDRA